MPAEIGNLINLQRLNLTNNQLQSLPVEILKIKKNLIIDESTYNINNLNIDNKILIFSELSNVLINIPKNINEIWLAEFCFLINKNYFNKKQNFEKRLPFGCIIHYYIKNF